MANANSSLDHVFFFVNNQSTTSLGGKRDSIHSTGPSQSASTHSESTSADSSDGEATNSSTSSGSSSSSSPTSKSASRLRTTGLSPFAEVFTPTAPSTANAAPDASFTDGRRSHLAGTGQQVYEIRETSDRGHAIFAATFIPAGTRIICESPLLRISENQLHLAWGSYERLPNAKKAAFDKLHFYASPRIDLEQASRTRLIDLDDTNLDEDDVAELVAEQVRVMGTFAANNFAAGRGLSVFETSARINHSCVPNVHHSFNPTLQKQTVHAVRDIQSGEELLTTYLGGPGNYFVSVQRQEMLQESYGFSCGGERTQPTAGGNMGTDGDSGAESNADRREHVDDAKPSQESGALPNGVTGQDAVGESVNTCLACSDKTGQSDHRRGMLALLAWGMQQYLEGLSLGEPAVPASPEAALYQAEAMIHLLREEGLLSMELIKAYRTASMQALALRDFNKAIDYAYFEAEIERICLGTELDDLVKLGQGSAAWIANVRETAATFGVTVRKQKKNKKNKKGKKAAPEDQGLKTDQKSVQNRAKKQARKEKTFAKLDAERAERQAKRAEEDEERKKKEYEASWPAVGVPAASSASDAREKSPVTATSAPKPAASTA